MQRYDSSGGVGVGQKRSAELPTSPPADLRWYRGRPSRTTNSAMLPSTLRRVARTRSGNPGQGHHYIASSAASHLGERGNESLQPYQITVGASGRTLMSIGRRFVGDTHGRARADLGRPPFDAATDQQVREIIASTRGPSRRADQRTAWVFSSFPRPLQPLVRDRGRRG